MPELVGREPATGEVISVVVRDGLIAEIERTGPGADLPWLVPGLVDLQVNGWAGYDVNAADVDVETIASLVNALAEAGTTTFLPTIITAAPEAICQALDVIAQARRADSRVAHAIPFVHLEGPWISADEGPRGVHPPEQIRPGGLDEFDRYQRAADGLIGIVTLSPHHQDSAAFVAALVDRGVRVALGHTHASADQIRAAAAAGATLSTHLGNGAHSEIARHPNYIWAQLAEDRLTACFIADGHHLPPDTLTAMLRAKGLGRSMLVSDSVALGGLAPGEYETPVGGQVELTADGALVQIGTPYLAGAACALIDGVRTCALDLGLGLPAALDLAAHRPGALVGGRGRIEPGSPADLLLLDDDLRLQQVSVAAG